MREFLYVLLISAYFFRKDTQAPNLSIWAFGKEVSIAEFAETVADVVGYGGKIIFDPSKPDGTPRKTLDASRLPSLGWAALRERGQQDHE
jgi:GDP-L-fucose synthase